MGASGVRMGVGVGCGVGHVAMWPRLAVVSCVPCAVGVGVLGVGCWCGHGCTVLGAIRCAVDSRIEPSPVGSLCGVFVWPLPHMGRSWCGCWYMWQCGTNIANRHGCGVAPSWHGTGGGGVGAGALSGANTPFLKKRKKKKTKKSILRRFKGFKILWWYSCSFSW